MKARKVPGGKAAGGSRRRDGLARRAVVGRLGGVRRGRLTVIEGPERRTFGPAEGGEEPRATVTVNDARFYRRVCFGGGLGAAEAYMDGDWSCDDLTALFRLFLRNLELADHMEGGTARVMEPAAKAFHWLRRNTRRGSRRNIREHYDLGNEFFELFLDDTLTYSCGIFERGEATLRDAQTAKLDRLCRKLELGAEDQVLEIGTGWGSFALHAAGRYGCRVTTTTISEKQFGWATERIQRAGLGDRVTVLLSDYRDLGGRYDKLVSIEMIEAVGHGYLDTYFGQCSRLLKPEGLMGLQAIVMGDQRYEGYRRRVDFIQRYIFPGGLLPSLTAMCESMKRSTDLRLIHLEDITPHYARTLRMWRERFLAHLEEVRALGYAERFVRMWEYYLCYCEAGFEERHIGDVQMVFAKPDCRREPILAPLGASGRE